MRSAWGLRPAPSFVHGRVAVCLCRVRKRMRPEDQRANTQVGKQTTVTRRAAQSMADTNASGCYSRLLREANTLKNQQTDRTAGAAPRVRSGKMSTVGDVCRGGAWCGACPASGAWIVGSPAGAPGRAAAARPLRLQRLRLAIFSRPRGLWGVCGRVALSSRQKPRFLPGPLRAAATELMSAKRCPIWGVGAFC